MVHRRRPRGDRRPSRRNFIVGLAAGSGAALVGTLGYKTARSDSAGAEDELAFLDLRTATGAVMSRTVSPVELTRACLSRIERFDAQLGAFITVTDDSALERARRAETELAAGRWRGPLHGIPITLKDNIDTAGLRTTAVGRAWRRPRLAP